MAHIWSLVHLVAKQPVLLFDELSCDAFTGTESPVYNVKAAVTAVFIMLKCH